MLATITILPADRTQAGLWSWGFRPFFLVSALWAILALAVWIDLYLGGGALPSRFDISRRSGINGYTDIVSVPASVARRAYQAAARGEDSRFFYVRRFISESGAPDQFVVVTMRLSGNGAGVPFSLTDVQLDFGADKGPRDGIERQPRSLYQLRSAPRAERPQA